MVVVVIAAAGAVVVVVERPNNIQSVSQGRIRFDHRTCCHNEQIQIRLAVSLVHSTLTPGQPVLALTL